MSGKSILKRTLSVILSVAMLETLMPINVLATETSDITEDYIQEYTMEESNEYINSSEDAADDDEQPQTVDESETEYEEKTTLDNDEDVSEEETTIEETESEEDTTTEEDKSVIIKDSKVSDKYNVIGDGQWVYDVVDNYAVVMGYNDYSVKDLSIPYTIDGYYVNGIGEKAFSDNTELSSLYVNGNVISIAGDAFEGIDVTLSGYNGTEVLKYADNHGISSVNKTDVDYFTFTDKVIDYSYVESGRYYVVSENEIRIGAPEAAQLKVGSIFYVPEKIGEFIEIYEVASLSEKGDWIDVKFSIANEEDALLRIYMENVELTPDWDNAIWADGVELIDEKISGSWAVEASKNLKYTHKIGKSNLSFSVEGKLGITGKVTLDYSFIRGQLIELSVITEPSITFKGELKKDSGLNTDEKDYLETVAKSLEKEGSSFEIYICTLPLVSVAGVATVSAAVYIKVDINGTISVSVKGSGKMGVEYNKSKKSFESVNDWSWGKPVVDIGGSFAVGPAEALQLDVAVLGKIMSVELFEGVTGEVTWSSKHTECLDADIGYKISLTIKLKKDLLKNDNNSLTSSTNTVLGEKKGQLIKLHFEDWKRVDVCTYKDSFTVEFVTDCPTGLDSQSFNGGDKIDEPIITYSGHKLEGWYTDKDFTTKWDFENDTVTDDITLYAKWLENVYTVHYVCNDGVSDFYEEYSYGEKLEKPIDLMRTNYKFNGWYKDSNCTEAWDFANDTMPNTDISLYAGWTYENEYNPYSGGMYDEGNLKYNGHIYAVYSFRGSFNEAEDLCESLGGHLATITSKDENDAVYAYVRSMGYTSAFFGGTDQDKEGEWKWVNGEEWTWTNWGASEPNNEGGVENYVMFYTPLTSGQWNDGRIIGNVAIICEWDGENTIESKAGITYKEYDNYAEVTGIKGDISNLSIDSSYNGKKVTAIATDAFKNNKVLETITLPSSITTIGNNAFYGCTSLKSITIPNSVVSMGTHVFDGDTSLTKVVWSNKLSSIPEYAFNNCTMLEEITNIDKVTVINNYSFYNCKKLATFTFPSNLSKIGAYAFANDVSLTNGMLPDTVSSIGNYAYYGCTGLTSIIIPSGVTSIPQYAFYNCTSATTIIIPRNVTSIVATNAFGSVNGTFKVYSKSYAETWCKNNGKSYELIGTSTSRVSYHTGLLSGQNSLNTKSETLVSDVYIEAGKRITEPDISIEGYTLVGWYTDSDYTNQWDFANDTVSGENITLYAKWVQDESAFEYTVSNGRATITNYSGADSTVIIPETLGGYTTYAIADGSFVSDSVTSIQIPSCVNIIESGAFRYLTNLYEIKIPNSTAFSVVDGILYTYSKNRLICAPQGRVYVTYEVPDGTEIIGKQAFANHTELIDITIPDSVTSIEDDVFEGNHNITIYGSVDTCVAKTYAERYSYDYNIYHMNYYNGTEILYTANIQAGSIIEDYYVPTQDFMTFGGWYKDSSFSEQWDFDTDIMPATDTSLYLKWDSDFAVETMENSVTITGYYGSLANIIIPETINGYNVTAIASNAISSGIIKVTIPSSVTTIETNAIPVSVIICGDVDSVAQTYAQDTGNTFEVREYTVTFDSVGGSQVADMLAAPGDTIQLPTPVKTNYYFAGWYTDSEYLVEWTSEDVMPTFDLNLYALWKISNINNVDSYDYNILEDGTIEITYYSGTKSSLNIPDTINGYTVSRVAAFAFKDNTRLITVTLPSTVNSIGEYAFADSNIRILKGYDNVETIGNYAFSGCTTLRTVPLTDKIESIGEGTFWGCTNLYEVSIPEGVISIGAKAFYGCQKLDTVTLSSTLTYIGSQAFRDTNLSEITLPSILKKQVEGVFDDGVQISYLAGAELKILSIKQTTKSKVTLVWSEVEEASCYALYRADSTSAKYKKIKSVSDTETFNAGLTSGNTYSFRIDAIDSNGNVIVSSETEEITITGFDLPVITSLVADSSTSAIMKVKSISGAEGYEIYRADSLDGNYTFLKTITTTSTVNTGLICGGDYYYKVRAYKIINDEKDYSDWSDIYYFHMPFKFMSAPENLIAYQSQDLMVDLSWDDVDGAEGYDVYRSVDGDEYTRFKSTVKASFQDDNIELGSTYAYKVLAYYDDNSETVSGDLSKEAKVTILDIATPMITNIVQKSENTVKITWNEIEGVDGYRLYRSTALNGTYSSIKNVTGTSTENYNLTKGTTYYYKVRGFINNSSGKQVWGGYSQAYSITINSLSKTEGLSISQTGSNMARLSWSAVSGANGYEVWCSVNGNSEYELVGDQTAKSITLTGLNDESMYYYKVRGYVLENGEKSYGDFSDSSAIQCVGTPTISVLEQSSSTAVALIWSKVTNASGYELWRSSDGGNKYSRLKTISGNTTNNYNLSSGATYLYKIRAYTTNENGDKVYGFYSNPASIKIIDTPIISSISQEDNNSVTLKWNNISNADGYVLYRSDENDGIYSPIKTVTTNETQDLELEANKTYYYKLVAYTTLDGIEQYSIASGTKYITILTVPTINEIEKVSASSVNISWSAVENATGYKLYRSDTIDGTYKCIKNITDGTSTANYNLTTEKYYYYKIAAYIEENNTTHVGVLSEASTIYMTNLATPSITSKVQSSDTSITLKLSSVSNSDGYEVYRASSIDGTYQKINDASTSIYEDAGLVLGNTYYYKLRAYKIVDNNKAYGALSNPIGVQMISEVVISNVEQTNSTSTLITWDAVYNATSYKLYSSTSEDGSYKCVKTTSDTSVGNYNLTTGNTYYYKVQAVIENDNVSNSGPLSSAMGVTLSDLGKAKITQLIQNGDLSASITWKAVSGAEGYEIAVADGEDSRYTTVETVTETNAKVNGVFLSDGSYWFKVRAYKTVNGAEVYGAYSVPTNIVLLSIPQITYLYEVSETSVQLTWQAVSNAEGYEVIKCVDGAEYTLVSTTDECGYIDEDVDVGTTVTYKVRPYITINGIKSYGEYSEDKSLTIVTLSSEEYPESAHSYSNNMDQTWSYTIEGAEALLLKFSSGSATESRYDNIYVMDGNGVVIGSYTGTNMAGKIIKITGDTVKIRLKTDSSVTSYGFKFEYIVPCAN